MSPADVPECDMPRIVPMPGDRACIHGTAVATGRAALLLLGRSGAGKSGVAAQMIAFGATLVCDDLAILSSGPGGLIVSAPDAAPDAMELRGFGVITVPRTGPSPLRGALLLVGNDARMPEPERIAILGRNLPLVRHARTADVAAKALIWLGSLT